MLLAVTLLFAVNQVIVKIVNLGLQPVFFAGLRSALAILFVGGWMLVAAIGWAATAFLARRAPMRDEGPELQLFWMVLVSAPILLVASPLFGPLIRDLQPGHILWLVVQASVVVTGGFITWLWLFSIYPVSTVASFSFLTPVFSLLLGVVFFQESVSWLLAVGAALVGLGIFLVNRPRRDSPIPDAGRSPKV